MLFEFWDGKINGLAKNLHSRKSFWKCRTLGVFFCLWNYSSSNIFLTHSFLKMDCPGLHLHSVGRETSFCPEETDFLQTVTTPCDTVAQRHLLIRLLLFLPLNAEELPPWIRTPLWEALCKHRATRQFLAQRKYNLRWGQRQNIDNRQNIQWDSLISKMDRGFCTP